MIVSLLLFMHVKNYRSVANLSIANVIYLAKNGRLALSARQASGFLGDMGKFHKAGGVPFPIP